MSTLHRRTPKSQPMLCRVIAFAWVLWLLQSVVLSGAGEGRGNMGHLMSYFIDWSVQGCRTMTSNGMDRALLDKATSTVAELNATKGTRNGAWTNELRVAQYEMHLRKRAIAEAQQRTLDLWRECQRPGAFDWVSNEGERRILLLRTNFLTLDDRKLLKQFEEEEAHRKESLKVDLDKLWEEVMKAKEASERSPQAPQPRAKLPLPKPD